MYDTMFIRKIKYFSEFSNGFFRNSCNGGLFMKNIFVDNKIIAQDNPVYIIFCRWL